MVLIFCISSYPISSEIAIFSSSDKLLHIIEYGILSLLIYFAFRSSNIPDHYSLGMAFAISFLYGVSDEIHQYFVPGRQSDILDAVADGIGSVVFLLVIKSKNYFFLK